MAQALSPVHPPSIVTVPPSCRFDGDGDYVSIVDFDYESAVRCPLAHLSPHCGRAFDLVLALSPTALNRNCGSTMLQGTFSVSFWMRKEECTSGTYEYIYSHHSSIGADMWSSSSLNIYLACEETGGGYSTLGGTVLRYNLYDTLGQTAMFDYALHEAGNFDAVTNVWIHQILTVTASSLQTFDDGMLVDDSACTRTTAGSAALASCPYGFYTSAGVGPSLADSGGAYPRPSNLSPPFRAAGGAGPVFDFGTALILGGRADINPNRHFQGTLALVNVYSSVLSPTDANCLFRAGDAALPDPAAGSAVCAPNPCLNGGTCNEIFGNYYCR